MYQNQKTKIEWLKKEIDGLERNPGHDAQQRWERSQYLGRLRVNLAEALAQRDVERLDAPSRSTVSDPMLETALAHVADTEQRLSYLPATVAELEEYAGIRQLAESNPTEYLSKALTFAEKFYNRIVTITQPSDAEQETRRAALNMREQARQLKDTQ